LAGLAAAAICLAIWSFAPRSLSGRIDIVGLPTYGNFNHQTMFWAYRLVVFVVPILVIAFYAVLARFGPLATRRVTTQRTPVRLVEEPETTPIARETGGFRPGALPRVALPLSVVIAAVGARDGRVGGLALAAGAAYLLALAVAGAVWTRFAQRPEAAQPESGRSRFWSGIALANGVGGSVVALLGLWFVSHSTVVVLQGTVQRWPWLPLWLAVLGIAAVLVWVRLQVRRNRPARTIEKALLVYLVGAVALFLALSRLPIPIDWFQGFDDAQALAGASLLERGHFPWRDLLFIHGLLPDVLRGTLSLAVFGETVWGGVAGMTVLLGPLCAVFLYYFVAWFSKGSPWMLLVTAVAVCANLHPPLDARFLFVPLTLILFGETIRRRSGPWAAALTVALFVQSVLAPETSFLVLPVLGCLVAADVVHREPGASRWQVLRMTRWCVAAGLVVLVVWCAVLAAFGALQPFVEYYAIFGPGHNEAGALPMNNYSDWYLRWAAGAGAALLTLWATVWRIRRRGDWTPQDWVALGLAGFVMFYEEKALGRFDSDHVQQVMAVSVPLLLLWLWKGTRFVDRHVEWFTAVRLRVTPVRYVAASVVLLATVLVFAETVENTVRQVDNRHRLSVPYDANFPRLGYTLPEAIDTDLLRDLDTALRAYAGDQPVFDMANAPGYLYFLLGREPGSRFYHVSMAIPPHSQDILIEELKQSPPPVVVFQTTRIGLSSWDDILNNVRHYKVAQYVLDGWVPIIRTQGNLLLVRRDLVDKGLPTPKLSEPPATSDLYFDGGNCAWGASGNFLQSLPAGPSTRLPVQPLGKRTLMNISGWALDPNTGKPASSVVVVHGDRVVASTVPSIERADVAKATGVTTSTSGFAFSKLPVDSDAIGVYLLAADGKLYPLNGNPQTPPASVRFADGSVVPTATAKAGRIDGLTSTPGTVGRIDLPSGFDLARYRLATLHTDGAKLGNDKIVISDLPGHDGHSITATSLPVRDGDLSLRVGSCLQWHGYQSTRPLYVAQEGAVPVTAVTISGVAG
jgi:hypothetical protein